MCATGLGFLNVFGYNYWGVVQDRSPQHPGTVNCIIPDGFDSNVLYTGCSDGCIRSLTLHPNSINGELCHLNDSIEKMQIFEVQRDGKDYRFILSSTCSDCFLYLDDLNNFDKSRNYSVKISKRRKIPEVDKGQEIKKSFFAELE